jgi:hypothetical protein
MKYPKLGDKIRVNAHHWARPHEEGTVVAELPRSRYEVLFDNVGIGYNNGKLLIISAADLTIVD